MSVKLVETVAVSESIPEGNEEARGVSLDEGGRSEGGAIHTLAARQNVFLSVPLGSRASAAADRAPPCSACGSLPRAYHHTSAARHVLRDTHENSDNWQKKRSIIYKYIHTTVQKFGVSDSFLL